VKIFHMEKEKRGGMETGVFPLEGVLWGEEGAGGTLFVKKRKNRRKL